MISQVFSGFQVLVCLRGDQWALGPGSVVDSRLQARVPLQVRVTKSRILFHRICGIFFLPQIRLMLHQACKKTTTNISSGFTYQFVHLGDLAKVVLQNLSTVKVSSNKISFICTTNKQLSNSEAVPCQLTSYQQFLSIWFCDSCEGQLISSLMFFLGPLVYQHYRLTVFFLLTTENPSLLKQVNAYDVQNQSQHGLKEREENVRPILFSHFSVY